MCARFAQFQISLVMQAFGMGLPLPVEDRYNLAPTDVAWLITERNEVKPMQWGLVPYWANDHKIGVKMFNARSETAAEKTSFKVPFKRRRCLIPFNGFYEWTGPKGAKQPWFITVPGEPVALAGLWDYWERGEGYLETFTVLTCEPNELVGELHTRMPVIMDVRQGHKWLAGPDQDLLVPFESKRMAAYRVGPGISRRGSEGASLIEPIADFDEPSEEEQGSLF